jgi:copper homeostasis protein CutC
LQQPQSRGRLRARLGDRHRADPTTADVAEVHALIRDELRRLVGKAEQGRVRILYGGSVKPSNAAELLASRTSTARSSAGAASWRRISSGSRGLI